MPTPNDNYDPSWENKWLAARFRVETVGDYESLREMWLHLDERFPTLDEYYSALVSRLQEDFRWVSKSDVKNIFPFDPVGGAAG